MEYLAKAYSWLVVNKEELLTAVIGIGVILETLNSIFPTKDKNSFLEKAGKFISELTKKLPSNVKKESNKIEDKKE
jgi:hypothetical protein